jgi:enamine deaminase RidA (YjgF/YER057c/UK114 family)
LKLEFTYASQWIGYYLIKYISKPMADFKKHIEDINKSIQVNMPSWTKKIAEVLSWFMRLGDTLWRVGEVFFNVLDRIGPKTIAIIATFASVGKLIMSGPFGMFLALFGGILLVIEDFFTYMDGGKSAMADLWKQLGDQKTLLQFRDNIVNVTKSFGELLKNIVQLFVKIVSSKTVFDGVITFLDTINILVNGISTAITGISGELERLDKLGFKGYVNEIPSRLNDYTLDNPMGLGGGYGSFKDAPNYYITGSDPYATAKKIQENAGHDMSGMLRNLQGVTP